MLARPTGRGDPGEDPLEMQRISCLTCQEQQLRVDIRANDSMSHHNLTQST